MRLPVSARIARMVAGLGLAASIATFAPCAEAAPDTGTRLVACGGESCLLVTGRRSDLTSSVHINGHRVEVQGARAWKVRLPLDTVRAWSLPQARTIEIAVADPASGKAEVQRADLPIGLLGHNVDLASLVVGS